MIFTAYHVILIRAISGNIILPEIPVKEGHRESTTAKTEAESDHLVLTPDPPTRGQYFQ
jgi:hypothetical protein